MPLLRQDVSTKEWVIIATERAKRPDQFAQAQIERRQNDAGKFCPFCPGNEDKTPPEVLAFRKDSPPNSEGWWVRVIPNKFASLVPQGSLQRRHDHDFFPSLDGIGVHEVIVESPAHDRPIPLLEQKQVEEILFAYRTRFRELRETSAWKAIIIFKNHGERTGTSLVHPHSQLVATPIVPRDVRLRFEVAQEYYNFIIHTAPLEDEDKDYYLWHVQILPRLTTIAGFELGSGIYINTALPEATAAFIRETQFD